jgi:hypothetical protein
MIEAEDIYNSTKHAFIDAMKETGRSIALPLNPFRAERTLPDGDVDPVNVVGMRFDPAAGEWLFVYITSSGSGSIYVSEDVELNGELPEIGEAPKADHAAGGSPSAARSLVILDASVTPDSISSISTLASPERMAN